MLKFVIKIMILALIAAFGSFWATEHLGKNNISQEIAKAVTPIVAIGDLAHNPGKYDGLLVQVSGRPIQNAKLAALGYGGIVLEDESGDKIVVLVKNGIPVADAAGLVTIVGVYKQLFEIGPYAYPVLIMS